MTLTPAPALTRLEILHQHAEQKALKAMTPSEHMIYTAWKKDAVNLPPLNFVTNKEPITGGAKSLRRYKRRADAINIIWGTR